MRCPECVDGRLDAAHGLFNNLPCCHARSLAQTPRNRQKEAADAIKRVLPEYWPAIRQEAVEIIEARKGAA